MFREFLSRLKQLGNSQPLTWHYPQKQVVLTAQLGKVDVKSVIAFDDQRLVRRIEAAYSLACLRPVLGDGGFWLAEYAALKQYEHDRLIARDAGAVLRDPARSNLFYGFDALVKLPGGKPKNAEQEAWMTYDALLQLASALGEVRLHNPEAPHPAQLPDIEDLLEDLDRAVGFRIDFPNPFPDEVGLATSRGVATYRCAQSIYQAWRIAELVQHRGNARVLEIGPGLGRTAYYAFRLGLRDYTLIDIPLSSAAQGYFLGRVLGENAVSLFGESSAAPITVAPPSHFLDGAESFDLVVNVDSLTEMSHTVADSYWRRIQRGVPLFLSINHERNPFTFRDLYVASGHAACVKRAQYWLRRGYVEELAVLEASHQ